MAAAQRKRPWYLVLALVGAMALGATGACSGWSTVLLYRESVDPSLIGSRIPDEADRTAVVSRFEAYVHALDRAKSRGWPLAVATLLLGTAVLAAAMRALAGNSGARSALIQLVIAQATINGVSYALLRDVLEARVRLLEADKSADLHASVGDRPKADEQARAYARVLRAATPFEFGMYTLGSALIVLALTRRRSRELLDSPKEAMGER
jgi:hypothetical protein